MEQVDHRRERGRGPDGSGPLPQFDLRALERFDPDQTIERLPRLFLPAMPASTPARARHGAPPANEVDAADLAVTVEIVPELSASDLVDDEEDAIIPVVVSAPRTTMRPPPPRPLPPLVLPAPVAVPVDLDRLLARARAEASRSPEYFRPAPAMTTSDEAIRILRDRQAAPHGVRRTLALVAGTVVAFAVMAVTVGVAVGHSAPAARSPSSIRVLRQAAAAAPVAMSAVIERPSIPSMSVQSLPRVESGTISLAAVAASHRLFVDGHLVEAGSAVVTCGTHLVQVGSRGQRKYVNVPCGQEIVLGN